MEWGWWGCSVVKEMWEAVSVETKRLCEQGMEGYRRAGLGVTVSEVEE